MRYLLDTNSLSYAVVNRRGKSTDLFTLREVAEERTSDSDEMQKISRAGITILDLEPKHLKQMIDVMNEHAGDTKLIRLYTGEGAGDIVLLAFILAEHSTVEQMFPEKYTLVTTDKRLREVAETYGINCVDQIL